MPVRKVSNRGKNIIGRFPSLKLQRMVAFESLIERDYVYLLDYDLDITWFEEQPLTIEYEHEGKKLRYTPDFHLIERGQDVLVECKPLSLIDTAENRRKFEAGRTWCAGQGWTFRVVTDHDIRTGFRLQNVKLLTRYARHEVQPAITGRIVALLHEAQIPMPMDEVVKQARTNTPAIVIATLLHMAFHHQLFIPLDNAPLCGSTPVSLYPFKSGEVDAWEPNVFQPESGSTGRMPLTRSGSCCRKAKSASKTSRPGPPRPSTCRR